MKSSIFVFLFVVATCFANSEKPHGSGADEEPKPVRFERETSGKEGHLDTEHKAPAKRDADQKEGEKSGIDAQKAPHLELENEGKPRFKRAKSGKEGHLETEQRRPSKRDAEKKQEEKSGVEKGSQFELEEEGKLRFERGTDADKHADPEILETERKPTWKRDADEVKKYPFEMEEDRKHPRFFRSTVRTDKSGIEMSAEMKRDPRDSDKSLEADQEKPRFFRGTEPEKGPNMGDRFHPTAWF